MQIIKATWKYKDQVQTFSHYDITMMTLHSYKLLHRFMNLVNIYPFCIYKNINES